MTITLSFGAWLIPAFVTVFAYASAIIVTRQTGPSHDWVGGWFTLIVYGLATILGLFVWLIWALLT